MDNPVDSVIDNESEAARGGNGDNMDNFMDSTIDNEDNVTSGGNGNITEVSMVNDDKLNRAAGWVTGLDGPAWSMAGAAEASGTRSGKDYHAQANTLRVVNLLGAAVNPHEHSAPRSYDAAIKGANADKWKAAAKAESDKLREKCMVEEIPRKEVPEGVSIIRPVTVLAEKYNSKGEVIGVKVRFCADGSRRVVQQDEISKLIASPVTSMDSIRLTTAVGAGLGHVSFVMDYEGAYLNAELPEPVYMYPPKGYDGARDVILKVPRALYGLQEAGGLWFRLITAQLEGIGFKGHACDPCLLVRYTKTEELETAINLYVDDLRVYCQDEQTRERVMRQLEDLFVVSRADTEDGMFLGSNFESHVTFDSMDAAPYLERLKKKYTGEGLHDVFLPLAPKTELKPREGEPASQQEKEMYASLIGEVLWISKSVRLDVAVHVGKLAQFVSNPSSEHLDYATRVLEYLITTKDVGLKFPRDLDGVKRDDRHKLVAYADADNAGNWDLTTTAGNVFTFNGAVFHWSSKKVPYLVLSTTEAEIAALISCVKGVLVYRQLLEHLKMRQEEPTVVYTDSQSGLHAMFRPYTSQRVRHFSVKLHWLKQQEQDGHVLFRKISTHENWADCLTKPLPKVTLERFRDAMMGRM